VTLDATRPPEKLAIEIAKLWASELVKARR
jgi:hypothetical protein